MQARGLSTNGTSPCYPSRMRNWDAEFQLSWVEQIQKEKELDPNRVSQGAGAPVSKHAPETSELAISQLFNIAEMITHV